MMKTPTTMIGVALFLIAKSTNAALITPCGGPGVCYHVNFGTQVLDYEIGGSNLADEVPTAAIPNIFLEQELQFSDDGDPWTVDTKKIRASINTTTPNPGSFGTWGTLNQNYVGSRALFQNQNTGTTVIESVSNLSNLFHQNPIETYVTFDFVSIDISELTNKSSYLPTSVIFNAEKRNGTTVSETVSLDLTFGLETFTFGNNFQDVTKVWWSQTPDWHQFDNIVLGNVTASTVPIPPALWLFSSGLLGLIGVARKKAA